MAGVSRNLINWFPVPADKKVSGSLIYSLACLNYFSIESSPYKIQACKCGPHRGGPNFSAAQGEFLTMMPLTPSFKNNSRDKLIIIDVVIHENE